MVNYVIKEYVRYVLQHQHVKNSTQDLFVTQRLVNVLFAVYIVSVVMEKFVGIIIFVLMVAKKMVVQMDKYVIIKDNCVLHVLKINNVKINILIKI